MLAIICPPCRHAIPPQPSCKLLCIDGADIREGGVDQVLIPMQGDNEVEPGPAHLPISVHPVQFRAPLLNSDKGPAVSAEAPRKKPHCAALSVEHVAPDLTLCSMPSGSIQWGTAARTSFARSVLALRCAPHGRSGLAGGTPRRLQGRN